MGLKILAFGGSSSKNSINKSFAHFAAKQFPNAEIKMLDLNDFEMPVFSVDKEAVFPTQAKEFAQHIDHCDLIVMSLAEHNGSYSAAFKNIFDWVSRIPQRSVFNNKPIFLLSTSPGPRGGSSVLETAHKRFPFNGGVVVGAMSLPSFGQNFSHTEGITHPELLAQFKEQVKVVINALDKKV